MLNRFVTGSITAANGATGIGLLYILLTKINRYIFEEELEYVPKAGQAAIFGGITGALCRATLGARPALVGGIIGATAAPIAHLIASRFLPNAII